MAYNEITLPGWQQLVRRLFGLTGPGGNVPVLAPEIQPVAIVQEVAPEHSVMRGLTPWFAVMAHDFTDLEIGATELRNPTGSNLLAVVEGIIAQFMVRDTGADHFNSQMLMTYRDPSLAAYTQLDAGVVTRDRRRGTATGSLSGLETRWEANLHASSGLVLSLKGFSITAADDRPLTFDLTLPAPVVLLPGSAVSVIQSLNVEFDVKTIRWTAWGYYRTFETEEVGA